MPYTAEGYRARALRNAMPKPEVILWSALKRLRAEGFHIRRQAPFRGYYLDFVCFSRRVDIEIDGESHDDPEQAAHDTIRGWCAPARRLQGAEVLEQRGARGP